MGNGIIGGHSRSRWKLSENWYTPPEIIKAFGTFDLDPCSSVNRPWDTALRHFERENCDGLKEEWSGKVWCNPPYGEKTSQWLSRCCDHNNCMVLIFAKTETNWFHQYVWKKASAFRFIQGRIFLYHEDGSRGKFSSGGPSVLVAYGKECAVELFDCSIKGKFVFNYSRYS